MDLLAFELGEQLNNRKVEYPLHKGLWDKFNYPNFDINFQKWKPIKYLNDDGTEFSDEIDEVPNNKGGLYLFYVKCHIITGITEFPLYVGRAQLTKGQNLRKRTKEYFQKYSKNNERGKIFKMFQYWGKELYLAFITFDENDDIKNIEKDITNYLLLPMNDFIPDQEVRQAISAF